MRETTVLILFLLWTSGCVRSHSPNFPEGLPDTGRPALHAVQNARLHELMAEMNSLMFDRMRTELDIDRERRRRAAQIADSARAMSETVGRILAALPTLNLSPGEQEAFAALANKLRDQSMLLEDQARANFIDAIPQTLDQISLTCTACHQLFRDTGA